MKKVILMLAVGMFMFTSCKKETIEPTPVVENPTNPVVTADEVPMNLQVYIKDEGMGVSGYDFKVVVKSSTESIDSLTTSFTNYTDGTSAPIYATLQCDVDTSANYTIEVFNSSGTSLVTVPLSFFFEDYILINEAGIVGTVTGEIDNHDDIGSQTASQAHVVLAIGI